MTNDIQTLFPGKEITIAGETIQITPIKLGQLPKALALMMKIGSLVSASNGANDLAPVIAYGGDELLNLIAETTKKPRAFIDDLYADDAVELVTAFLEVNKSFFVEKVLPKFPGLAEKLSNFQKQSSS